MNRRIAWRCVVAAGLTVLLLPVIGQINLRLCSFYPTECKKPGLSSVSST
jgi:hypothetical protein